MQETRVHSLGRFPGEGNGNPFSILAWEIPWTEEPGDYTKSWTRPFGVQWSHKELDTTEHACTFIPLMIVLGPLSKIILINLCLFLCQCLIVLVVIAFILFFFFGHTACRVLVPQQGFPGSSNDKKFTCHEGNLGLIPGLGRSPGRGHGNPLQYSCLENPHGQRSLAGYGPWRRKESDTSEWLSNTHTQPGIKPLPPSGDAWSLNHRATGKSLGL